MDKLIVGYSCDGITLFSNKNKWRTDSCYNINEPWIYYGSQSKRPYFVWFHLYEMSHIEKSIAKVD